MVSANRKPSARVADELLANPGRFRFFQAIRLLERILIKRGFAVGGEAGESRSTEPIRYRSSPSLEFPANEIDRIEDEKDRFRATIRAFGFMGPSGVLPLHYTELLIECLARKDSALRDFCDLLTQRMTSLFYKAWERTHVEVGYERSPADPFTERMYSLVGIGSPSLRGRMSLEDQALLFYGGFLSRRPAPAVALENLLEDYFRLPVKVVPFVGQWVVLDDSILSSLRSDGRGGGNNTLGVDVTLGGYAWIPHSRYRIRMGPVGLAQYQDLLPGRRGFQRLRDLTYFYVGKEFVAELQLIVERGAVPGMQLQGKESEDGAQLGWKSWLASESVAREDDQVVLVLPRE
jgi:type VI secretion system protein ImpH